MNGVNVGEACPCVWLLEMHPYVAAHFALYKLNNNKIMLQGPLQTQ